MKSYILKPKSVKKSDIENKIYSLLAAEHRKVEVFNNNQKPIGDLVDFESVGEQIEVQEYLTFKSNYYLGTISCMSLIYDKTKGECVSPDVYKQSKKKLKRGDVVISRNASLGKISYVNDDVNVILNGGLSYLRFKNEFKYYSIAFFLVNYGAEYLTCLTSGGGTQQNAKRQNLLELKIPFPTIKNHSEPQKIEQLVSLITQNIINKEEQIKAKNQKIDDLIEKELKENQNHKNSFKYSYPKISEIKQETRLDTGIYEREFKEIDFLIRNYGGGFFNFKKNEIKTGRTPQDYFFTNKKNHKTSLWLTPKSIKSRQILSLQYLHTNQDTNLSDGDIIFTAIGTGCQGHTLIYDKESLGKTYINQNACAISLKNFFESKCFISAFMNSKLFEITISKRTSKGSVPAIYSSDIVNLNIPNFPEPKQQEIAKEYYFQIDKNQNLTLENYLQKETARNQQIGIFQLNMEIFELREKLEDIIDKIINDSPIEISWSY